MQTDLVSTGGVLIHTRLPDISATCSHFESGISFKPLSSESRDAQLRYSPFASNSPTNRIHNEPLVNYSRRREPSEAETTCKTERLANLRRRFPFFNKQNQGTLTLNGHSFILRSSLISPFLAFYLLSFRKFIYTK